jgi:hypothetical protein
MLVKSKRGWELPESAATDESVFMQRRQLVKAMAAGPMLLAAGLPLGAAAATDAEDPSAGLYPAKRNDLYKLDRPISGEKLVKTYNNFYEFGSHKKIYKAAQKMAIRPWEVVIDGLVEKERKIAIDDLLAALPLEERLYRHRCVERWSMAVPWIFVQEFSRLRKTTKLREICSDGDIARSGYDARIEAILVSLALCRRPDDGRSDQRPCLSRHWSLWQTSRQADGCATSPCRSLEIRLQVH